jgi:TonB-dependent starch-binding outer membrane protein SusC
MKIIYTALLILFPFSGFCQMIHGKIVNTNNEPLNSISVKVSGTTIGTETDNNGDFNLQIATLPIKLVITGTGYVPQTYLVSNYNVFKLTLVRKVNDLDEVQVIAYGTSTERNSVGSISKISGADISQQPIMNPLAGLEGMVPGLDVTASSGLPGSSYTLQIRGQNTINQTFANVPPMDQPLIIIDGVPVATQNENVNQFSSLASPGIGNVYHNTRGGISPFDAINPSDIESIEVLRDASATAIYGSRGGNGVIIITTKKGKAGKAEFNLNINDGGSWIGSQLPMMNTQQYLEMRKQAFANDGLTPDNTLYDAAYAPDLTVFDTNKYTNWKKYFLGNTAQMLNVNATLSGGNQNTQFRISSGFSRNTYVLPGDYADDRGNVSANIHHNSDDKKLTLDFSVLYSYEKNNSSGDPSFLTSAYTLDPDYPNPKDANGNVIWQYNGVPLDGSYAGYNPFAYLDELYNIQNVSLNSNLVIGYKLTPDLTFRTSFGYSTYNSNEYYGDPLSAQDPEYSPQANTRFGTNDLMSWIIEPQLAYKKSWQDFDIDVLLGGTLEKQTNYLEEVDGTGYINDDLIQSISGSPIQTATDAYSEYKYIAAFGRIDLKYQDQYILDITGNRDGSSRFGPDRQFGNFGSVGAGWIFTENASLKNQLGALSYGKLHASYGTIGNDQVADYVYLSRWAPTTTNYLGSIGYTPQNLYNPNFTWASTQKLEFGIDLGFLSDRLLFSATWYRTRTGDQLVNYNLPIQTGFNNVLENENALVQNTGIESSIQFNVLSGKNFKWHSSFNITIPRNKLIAFPGLAQSSYATSYQIGKPLSEIYGFRSAGVNPSNGLFQFYTANGQITENPQLKSGGSFNDEVPIGDLDPKFYGGWRNSFTYKNFDLLVLVNYTKQIGMNYLGSVYNYLPGNELNMPVNLLGAWKTPGQNSPYEVLSSQYGQAATDASYYVQSNAVYSDASYIRVKNISLSYTLPDKLSEKLKLHQVKVYVTAENFFTITDYKGNDPETQIFYGIPTLKTLSAGLQLTL